MPAHNNAKSNELAENFSRRRFLVTAGAGAMITPYVLSACSSNPLPDTGIDLPGTVVFTSKREGSWNIYMARFDTEWPLILTPDSFSEDSTPIWVDNGQKVVFVSDRNGYANLFRINDVSNPQGSTEQLTTLEGETAFTELSLDGVHVLFCHKTLTEPGWRVYTLDLLTGQAEALCDLPAGKTEIRIIDLNRILIGPRILSEINLSTGECEKYIYNYTDITPLDLNAQVSTFAYSRKTGKIYAAIDNSPFTYYRVYSWNYESASGYKTLAAGEIEWNDTYRCFRIPDMGGERDFILGSTRDSLANLDMPTYIGPWKVGIWSEEDTPNYFELDHMKRMRSDSLFADWTSVEHISD